MWTDQNYEEENKTEKFIAKLLRFGKFIANERIKSRVNIQRIIKTKGLHSWVETDKGIFRKENKNIPTYLFR